MTRPPAYNAVINYYPGNTAQVMVESKKSKSIYLGFNHHMDITFYYIGITDHAVNRVTIQFWK